MAESIETCPLWGGDFRATGYYNSGSLRYTVEDSPRGGGGYVLSEFVDIALNDSEKARLTTILVNRRIQGDLRPKITDEMVEDARRCPPLLVPERAERLLRYFVESSDNIGKQFKMGEGGAEQWRALAWSESEQWYQAFHFVEYLKSKGWIELTSYGETCTIEVLVDGYSEIAEQPTSVNSSQAFVAMWFDGETDAAFEDAISPAILNAGFKPVRIDRELNVDKIDDAIIANIRRSRFLVADFTHGNDGARGGVYYEAGLAHGLDLPVIFTCRRDMVDKLHFDTRQYVHILWDTNSLGNLYTELLDRIGARIGEGPETRANS